MGEVGRHIGHHLQALEYRGDLSHQFPGSSVEPGMDILALLGEDVGL
jgi:hypothetical protein